MDLLPSADTTFANSLLFCQSDNYFQHQGPQEEASTNTSIKCPDRRWSVRPVQPTLDSTLTSSVSSLSRFHPIHVNERAAPLQAASKKMKPRVTSPPLIRIWQGVGLPVQPSSRPALAAPSKVNLLRLRRSELIGPLGLARF